MSAVDPDAAFLDTNVWLYALVQTQDQDKAMKARSLLQEVRPVLSAQVINDICVNLIKKTAIQEHEVDELIRSLFARYQVVELSKSILLQASGLRAKYGFSYWDSLIVSFALESDITVLYSKDMHNGLVVEERLRIVNPFQKASSEP